MRISTSLAVAFQALGFAASAAYEGLFAVGAKAGGFNKHLCADGKKAMAENFRVFCDKANYPIYFHCAGGADRTGSLGYVLMGVLGVPRHDVEVEWEATFYPNLSELACTKDEWRSKQHFDEGFASYGDVNTPLTRRIELYLFDCGVTQEEIDRFRSIMLEPSCEGVVPLSDDSVAEISWRRGQDGRISFGSSLPEGWVVVERRPKFLNTCANSSAAHLPRFQRT